jgi:hypothetical protein
VPRRSYIVLPSHIVGLGGRLTASSAGIGGTARAWWSNRLGVQFDLTRSRLDSIDASSSMTSLQFAPSVLYALPNSVSNNFWIRPYAGGGGNFYRTTLSTGTPGVEDQPSEKGLAFRAFGGVEATFSGMPQFALSADLGRSWREKPVPGFESNPIDFSVSAHWYVK